MSRRVAIVFDREFGDRLGDLGATQNQLHFFDALGAMV
jgi:hypothetical protein